MEIIINDSLSQQIQDIDFADSSAASSELVKAILLLAHPVGSYYWSSNATNPHDIFGGTWTQIKDRFIIAVGDSHTVGQSYGSNTKDISHTHGIEHTHVVPGVSHEHSLSNNGYAKIIIHANGKICYDEMKVSTYTSNFYTQGSGAGAESEADQWGAGLGGKTDVITPGDATTESQSTSTSGSGGSTELDITPACEAAYCWRRTA